MTLVVHSLRHRWHGNAKDESISASPALAASRRQDNGHASGYRSGEMRFGLRSGLGQIDGLRSGLDLVAIAPAGLSRIAHLVYPATLMPHQQKNCANCRQSGAARGGESTAALGLRVRTGTSLVAAISSPPAHRPGCAGRPAGPSLVDFVSCLRASRILSIADYSRN